MMMSYRCCRLLRPQQLSKHQNQRYFSSSLVEWSVEPLPNSSSPRFVGILTINAPDSYNALTVEIGKDFQAACRNLPKDDISAVIVRGAGDKAFSAGGNLHWLKSLHQNPIHINVDLMISFYKSFLCIRDIPVPTIAAMTGPAVGAGAGLALACDMRVATMDTKKLLGLNFTKLGIHTGMGGLHFLQQALPQSGVVNEILLAGKTLSASECFQLGLINRLVDTPLDVLPATMKLVQEVVGTQHPVAIRTLLRTIRSQQNVGLEQALHRDAYAQAVCYARDDWGEGVQAIVEKRIPEFGTYDEN